MALQSAGVLKFDTRALGEMTPRYLLEATVVPNKYCMHLCMSVLMILSDCYIPFGLSPISSIQGQRYVVKKKSFNNHRSLDLCSAKMS